MSGVEDPKRGLLGVCRHSGPACWKCVALDMERQRDEATQRADEWSSTHRTLVMAEATERHRREAAEAQVAALRGALRDLCIRFSNPASFDGQKEALDRARAALGETPAPGADGHAKEGGT